MYPEIANCFDTRPKTCYESGTISITYSKRDLSLRCELTVKDIRVGLPAPYGDGAKTQGHALYNRLLDAHAHRRKAGKRLGSSQVSKIFILKSLDFFIMLCPSFIGLYFVSKNVNFVSINDKI